MMIPNFSYSNSYYLLTLLSSSLLLLSSLVLLLFSYHYDHYIPAHYFSTFESQI